MVTIAHVCGVLKECSHPSYGQALSKAGENKGQTFAMNMEENSNSTVRPKQPNSSQITPQPFL